jgi:glycosyltransferase involved in cell wall biosynthesis
MINILHCTHTDILSDNRVLKEINSISKIHGVCVFGVGFKSNESGAESKQPVARIYTHELFGRRAALQFGIIRRFVVAIEMLIVACRYGVQVKPKIVHCHDAPVLLVGIFLKFFCASKIIYDAHELESKRNHQGHISSWLTIFVEKISWPFIDHLITVSPSIVDWYREKLGEKASTLVLNSPFIPSLGQSFDSLVEIKPLRRRFDIPSDCKIFIYLGLLMPGRGIQVLLDSFCSPGVRSHIVFIGYGSEVRLIEDYSVNYINIHYHPPVPHEHVVALASTADYGLCMIENVSLSDYYCLPNKLFEYAFSGIPVLASDFPDMKKIIQDYNLGETCNIDVESIVSAVKRIEGSNLKYEKKPIYALSWDAQEVSLHAAYNSILSQI